MPDSGDARESARGRRAVAQLITEGSEENKTFYAYTPGGSLELNCLNEPAAKFFEVGKEYYLDFTEATQEDLNK